MKDINFGNFVIRMTKYYSVKSSLELQYKNKLHFFASENDASGNHPTKNGQEMTWNSPG